MAPVTARDGVLVSAAVEHSKGVDEAWPYVQFHYSASRSLISQIIWAEHRALQLERWESLRLDGSDKVFGIMKEVCCGVLQRTAEGYQSAGSEKSGGSDSLGG